MVMAAFVDSSAPVASGQSTVALDVQAQGSKAVVLPPLPPTANGVQSL